MRRQDECLCRQIRGSVREAGGFVRGLRLGRPVPGFQNRACRIQLGAFNAKPAGNRRQLRRQVKEQTTIDLSSPRPPSYSETPPSTETMAAAAGKNVMNAAASAGKAATKGTGETFMKKGARRDPELYVCYGRICIL